MNDEQHQVGLNFRLYLAYFSRPDASMKHNSRSIPDVCYYRYIGSGEVSMSLDITLLLNPFFH